MPYAMNAALHARACRCELRFPHVLRSRLQLSSMMREGEFIIVKPVKKDDREKASAKKRKVNKDEEDQSNTKPATPNGKKKIKSSSNLKSNQEKSSSSATPASSSGPGKRGGKKVGERTRERSVSPPRPLDIDPDEPTYCLCDQVSYGEMIGCDNDLCPIEWFHFSCVQLSSKPKGKWFCPRCRGDKPTVMKPKAQFLKELEKFNKEKEDKVK